ncbi:hypothetical protein AHAS_Ahas05G0231200 [Arachis hypogaea]
MDNWHALIYASAAAAPGVSATNASLYKNNTLDRSLIKDKIVICTIEKVTENRRLKAMVIKEGGGVGMILIDHNTRDVGFEFVIPATLIGQDALEDLQSYINTERSVLNYLNLHHSFNSYLSPTLMVASGIPLLESIQQELFLIPNLYQKWQLFPPWGQM